jgi:hypothetical protein
MASDARHSFFVTVLARVRDLPKSLLGADAFNFTVFKNAIPKHRTNNEDRAQATPLRNLFDILDVYKPSTDFVNAPDIVPPKREKLECTVEDSDDSIVEAYFAMTTLMDDLSRLRAEISQLCGGYWRRGMGKSSLTRRDHFNDYEAGISGRHSLKVQPGYANEANAGDS